MDVKTFFKAFRHHSLSDEMEIEKLTAERDDFRAKYKRAATDLAAQAEEIAELHGWKSTALIYADEIAEMKKRVANADDRASRFEKLNVALFDEANALRPDAEAMRKKRAADRKRMAGKRGKDNG